MGDLSSLSKETTGGEKGKRLALGGWLSDTALAEKGDRVHSDIMSRRRHRTNGKKEIQIWR